MKKQVIIATLALALAAGTSVVSFAQEPETSTTLSAVEEQTEFAWGLGKGGCGRYSDAKRITKEERDARRAECASLTDEEREEFFAEKKARIEAKRAEFEKLTDEEKQELFAKRKAKRAECANLTEEEREAFFAEKKAEREERRADCPVLAGNEKALF